MNQHYMSASDFAEKYQKGELNDAQIIDVREQYEWDHYHLDKATLIPMNTIPMQLDRIDKDISAYIVCAHGVRSYYVMQYLLTNGFEKVINVEGGMAEVQLCLNNNLNTK